MTESNFPSQAVSDIEKISFEYGLKVAQAIESEWFDRNEDGNNIKIDYSQKTRNKNKALTTVDATKTYQFCYDKRHICEPDKYGNIDTLPFGHKLIK